MRRFNPEKELIKIQKGNKNKIIIGVCLLLLIIAIGSSYALYQIRYSKQIIYTTVQPFYSKDMQLAVYVDGVRQEEFPSKSEDILYGGYECEKDSKITFDKDDWSITLKTNKPDRCNIRFGTKYEDESGANYPELYQGMIPVYFKEGKIYIADVTSEWYNYDNNEWANAVLIDYENKKDKFYDENNNLLGGHEVSENDILQMYVWIPRYKYQLFNVGLEGTPKQLINIEFERGTNNTGNIKCTYTNNGDGTITEDCKDKSTNAEIKKGDWYTHPAFTFKGTTDVSGTELKGFWVGKFEPSDLKDETGWNTSIGEITILPNKTSMVNRSISTAFYAEQKLSSEGNKYNLDSNIVDTRVMKNIEWGAAAYLTQSTYGIYKDENTCNIDEMTFDNCRVWRNNTVQGISGAFGGTYTGCVGDTYNALAQFNDESNKPAQCKETNRWNTGGIKASTTGNIYGIYDMNGGASAYVMGLMINKEGTEPYYNNSGFNSGNMADKKYYDIYTYDINGNTYSRGHFGDATKEVLLNNVTSFRAWDGVYASFLYFSSTDNGKAWFIRATHCANNGVAGMFAFFPMDGYSHMGESFHSVLSAA